MKARLIRPSLFLDERLMNLGGDASFFLVGMLFLADREGRLDDRPLKIRAQILPYGTGDGEPMLSALAQSGLISRGEGYIQIEGFDAWVSPFQNEKQSMIPEDFKRSTTVEQSSLAQASRSLRQDTVKGLVKDKAKGTEEKLISEQEKIFLRNLWEMYPARTSENGAPAAKGNKLAAVAQIRRAMHSENLTEQDVLDIVGVYLEHPTLKSGYIQSVERFFGPTGRWYECWQALQSDRAEANR